MGYNQKLEAEVRFCNSTEATGKGGGIGPADQESAGPKFQNYNPQSLFTSLDCICIGTS